jgi:hypothetical protein
MPSRPATAQRSSTRPRLGEDQEGDAVELVIAWTMRRKFPATQ